MGVARSHGTLEGVAATGAVALEGDITDGRACATLEQATEVHGRVDLVVNAASPYGGDRSGPFGGGRLSERQRMRSSPGLPHQPARPLRFSPTAARFCSSRVALRP